MNGDRLRLALIYGGDSSERDVSISGGESIREALDPEKYEVTCYDPAQDLKRLVADAGRIDFCFLNLHGTNGEDGRMQGFLDLLGLPYQGSGVLGSALAMDKLSAKQCYRQAGLPVAPDRVLRRADTAVDLAGITETLGWPIVVKPARGGSSLGMGMATDRASLEAAIANGFKYDATLLLEACVQGIELTCGVLGNQELEALPVIEIAPGDAFAFFDYTAKYTPGATREICPARIPDDVAAAVKTYAIRAHQCLCCEGYSRTDMMLQGDTLFLLETNTLPGMTPNSLLPLAARTAGLSFSALLDRLVALGLSNHSEKRKG
ncbi:MAG: D-alanine--D-alanine ligase [Deltaproteobacteria bacterium]|nr:MAG: D-alanine--D-alanine ligase [Deltaproteobacteria bacterium]